MTTEDAIALIYDLKRNRSGGHESPHKPILLLALLDLIENGTITANRIEASDALRAAFTDYFKIVRQGNDQNSPHNPFYYLTSEGFWTLQPKRPDASLGSWTQLQSRGIWAELDPEFYALILQDLPRELLREAIYSRYFAEHRDTLRQVCREHTQHEVNDQQAVAEDALPGRDSAFRKLVTEIYDYRCAACGLRLHLDNIILVEAAHLIPWSDSRDDNPRNGMALCRNHHYAMDRFLIAPTPDNVWKVSKRLDRRLEGQKDLIQLNGENILLPNQKKYYPKLEALEWRSERLLG